jgi:hypothetical protein
MRVPYLVINNLLIIFLAARLVISCKYDNERKMISDKNSCYVSKLNQLENDSLFITVHKEFSDSFVTLKNRERILQFRQNVIDDAVFFSKKKDECILLILQKPMDTTLFGYGRAVYAKKEGIHWQFELSREYIFENDYLELFRDNSFFNISKLARYSILIDGMGDRQDCEIDENYWFKHGEE